MKPNDTAIIDVMSEKDVKVKDVMRKTGLSRATIFNFIKRHKNHIKRSERVVRYRYVCREETRDDN